MIDMKSILAATASDMPAVQPTADAMETKLSLKANPAQPQISPISETPVKRGRGRPRKDGGAGVNPSPDAVKAPPAVTPPKAAPSLAGVPQTPAPPSDMEIKLKAVAQQISSAIEMSGACLAGEGGAFNATEKMLMPVAIADYMRASGNTDLPPSIVLMMTIAPYYARVFTHKKDENSLSLFEKIVVTVMRFKDRKKKK